MLLLLLRRVNDRLSTVLVVALLFCFACCIQYMLLLLFSLLYPLVVLSARHVVIASNSLSRNCLLGRRPTGRRHRLFRRHREIGYHRRPLLTDRLS